MKKAAAVVVAVVSAVAAVVVVMAEAVATSRKVRGIVRKKDSALKHPGFRTGVFFYLHRRHGWAQRQPAPGAWFTTRPGGWEGRRMSPPAGCL